MAVTAAGTGAPAVPIAAHVDSAQGWIVVFATALCTFTVFGVTYSFGTFFSAMAADLDADKGSTALLFGLTVFFLMGLSLVTGRLADRFGPRPVVLVGATSMGLGLVLTSLVSSIWFGYLTYGVLIGIATSCCYVPMVANVGAWFDAKRTTALGVAVAGIGLGTLLGPLITSRLIDAHGWRPTYRILAAGSVAILLLCALLVRRAPGAGTAAPPPVKEIFGNRTFQRLYLSSLVMGVVLFVPFVFLVPYAKDEGIAAANAAWLVSLLGVGSLSGRLVLGAVASRIGLVKMFYLCLAVMAASFLVWLLAGGSFAALGAFALLLGVAYGGYVALAPAVCAHLFGTVGLAGLLGSLYTASGVGALVGPAGAGWLIDATDSYRWAILTCLVLGVASVFALPKIAKPEDA